jgi:hypothetical protein
LNLTSARSGSTPVVSQSIIRPMVPVGANRLLWAFLYPFVSPSSRQARQASIAAAWMPRSMPPRVLTWPQASACLRITRLCAVALRS